MIILLIKLVLHAIRENHMVLVEKKFSDVGADVSANPDLIIQN